MEFWLASIINLHSESFLDWNPVTSEDKVSELGFYHFDYFNQAVEISPRERYKSIHKLFGAKLCCIAFLPRKKNVISVLNIIFMGRLFWKRRPYASELNIYNSS